MGLDATVRCRCFEEGKLVPGPIPVGDLYVDEEGYISSRKLDKANLLEDLVDRYGSRLKGLVKDGGFAGKMQLFVQVE